MSAATKTTTQPVYLISGDDPSLIANEVRSLLGTLVGQRDASLVVEEVGGAGNEDLDVGAVLDAYLTPPFLVDLRIVVVRDIGRLNSDDVKRVTSTLENPPSGAVLVLVAGGGAMPRGFSKAIGEHGTVIDVAARRFAERKSYLAEHLRGAPVRLNAQAQQELSKHLGEDLGRLHGLLETLSSAYGQGVTVDAEMLQPFLGSRGAVPIFDLTDAIDKGDRAEALRVITRMMGPGGSSGHEILASLDYHFTRVARLEGADVRNGDDAAALLGIAAYPAKKVLDLARRMDGGSIKDAVELVANADLDLKGMTGLSEAMIMEILVARLSRVVGATKR